MPVTDLSGGTLRCQPLPRNCGLRTTTLYKRRMYTDIFVFSSSPFPSMCSWPLSRNGWKSMSVSTHSTDS